MPTLQERQNAMRQAPLAGGDVSSLEERQAAMGAPSLEERQQAMRQSNAPFDEKMKGLREGGAASAFDTAQRQEGEGRLVIVGGTRDALQGFLD